MTDQSAEEILKSLLDAMPTCPCCYQEYNITNRTPIILGCAHTVCAECTMALFQMNAERKVVCPSCRTHNFTSCHRADCVGFLKNFELCGTIEKLMKAREKLEKLNATFILPWKKEEPPTRRKLQKPIGAERQLNNHHEPVYEEPVPEYTRPHEMLRVLLDWAVVKDGFEATDRTYD